jgi:Zn finger protein HypA/HybF involved in hydrogenase expression
MRLENGVFCDLCEAFANNCYWKCDACNDGEWGYCNNCVMQGKHCTHPLQPLKALEDLDHAATTVNQLDGRLAAPSRAEADQLSSPPSTPKSASVVDGPVVLPLANLPFKPLTFHTVCDICTTPIAPSVTRYHCPQCNGGDYDICMSCYHGLVSAGKISHANGPQGWRKCPEGHRMVVIGFQDSGGGQRRVVDRDVVGGWTFVEDRSTTAPHPTTARKWRWKGDDGQEKATDPEYRSRTHSNSVRLPPDGGIGLVYYGKWNYFPDDATEKDLCFPKGAEIRESEDINGEWLWGYFAGKTGLFPAAYVDLLRKVTM